MPSGADLEYARMLARAGVPAATAQGYDAARLEQIGDNSEQAPTKSLKELSDLIDTGRLSENDLNNLVQYVTGITNGIIEGAVGDGIADDSDFIESILNSPFPYLPSGIFRVTRTLTLTTSTTTQYIPGYFLRGAGMERTTLRIDHNSGPAIRIISNTSLKYIRQLEISDLTIQAAASNSGQHGIEAISLLFGRFKGVKINGFGGDGFYVPLRTDLNVNSDVYQLGYTLFKDCVISNNAGYGINAPGGLAFAVTHLVNTQVVNNGAGGAWVACHTFKSERGVFGNNGGSSLGAGGGLTMGKVQATPTTFIDEGTEWDGNHNFHVWLKSISSAQLNGRFLAKEGFIVGALAPAVSIKLGDAGQGVRGVLIDSAHLRSDNANNYPHTFVEITGSDTTGVEVREPTYGTNTSALTKISGTGLTGGVTLIENGRRVYSRLNSPTLTVIARKNADQVIPQTTVTRVTWPDEQSDLGSLLDGTTGIYTPASPGYYRFEGFLYTESTVATTEEITISLRYSNNILKSITLFGNGQAKQSLPFEFGALLNVASGNYDIAISTNKVGGITLKGNTTMTHFLAYYR